METVIFDGEDGTELEFGILEQTRVGGINYLLVIDPEENDEENGSAAYILKDISEDGEMCIRDRNTALFLFHRKLRPMK